MRKVQSCVNMDLENIEWLKKQGGISKNINDMVTVLRKHSDLHISIKSRVEVEGVQTTEATIRAKEIIEQERVEREIKIRAHFRDFPHVIYLAKTRRKFTKSDLCKIKDELFYGKYNVIAEVTEIRKVLKDEMDLFDVEKYEEERGILKKVAK